VFESRHPDQLNQGLRILPGSRHGFKLNICHSVVTLARDRKAVATFRKRGPHQWQAQVRKKGYPLQTKTFETRAGAQAWARAVEVSTERVETPHLRATVGMLGQQTP